ncbi:AraC family transcriptional regulator [Caulobacter sp. UNC279MFTsu5.1]|uniref:helix-turn-helix domain-containing protein n=1 Tax=Caulobacter sp. UNC279MFTsu5.1 TaxID=1502775 RepID=UPI0008EAC160|nr:AraC family transcriptional regulator [Caulobacter sp. UNC279MFTsu5.1]SFK20362.1 AraC-type DNA-binding protein [Caulobacter sp. UNC279MFTsu5.1]
MTSSDATQTSTLPRDQTLILARLVTDASRAFDRDPDTARALVHRASQLLEAEVRRLTREPQTGKLAPWQVRTATAFIDQNRDRNLQVRDVAAAVRLSPSYFSHAFKETFGQSAKSYIIERRVARAKQLMLSTRDTLAQIALACGFSDQAHFCRTFGGLVGQTPSRWRRGRQERPADPPALAA